jgi:hypothetical protein
MKYTDTSAIFSDCGSYRYVLRRVWDYRRPWVCWVMLNPSTADGEADDNTIRKCVRFSDGWGYGGIVVVNLFAMRATKPKKLYKHTDPIGPENDHYIATWTGGVKLVVGAWGTHGVYKNRGREVADTLRLVRIPLYCLSVTKSGQPGHPLYLNGDLEPVPFDSLEAERKSA